MKKLLMTTALSSVLLLAACSDTEETETMKAEEAEVETESSEDSSERMNAEEKENAEEESEELSEEVESEENADVKPMENGIYEIQMARVEITGTEILPPDEYDEAAKDRLVVTYEVTSKVSPEEAGEVEVSPFNVWLATMEATQENDTSIVNLNYGFTPEEYFSYQDTEMNVIKKDATVENVAIYELDNRENPVILNATQGLGGQDLGTIEIDVSK